VYADEKLVAISEMQITTGRLILSPRLLNIVAQSLTKFFGIPKQHAGQCAQSLNKAFSFSLLDGKPGPFNHLYGGFLQPLAGCVSMFFWSIMANIARLFSGQKYRLPVSISPIGIPLGFS
jgi:hypothetical protein